MSNKEFVWDETSVKEFVERWWNFPKGAISDFLDREINRFYEEKSKQEPNKDYEIRGYEICSPENKIGSVLRKSDGEIFTIGDKVDIIGEIESITYEKNYPLPQDVVLHGAEKVVVLRYANKVKEPIPLFTTADLVHVYENQGYWHVDINWVISHYFATHGGIYGVSYEKRTFSTEDKARQYVEENERVFSLNDIIGVIGYEISLRDLDHIKEFKKIAQQRINDKV